MTINSIERYSDQSKTEILEQFGLNGFQKMLK